jgi:hypothetical protein
MNTFVLATVLLAGLTQASYGTVSEPMYGTSPSQNVTSIAPPTSSMPARRRTIATDAVGLLGEAYLPAQAQQTVLVVPTPDLTPDSLVELTEDMTVMCRIFDKALLPSRVNVGTSDGARSRILRYLTNEVDQQTAQGLYLDGYGALFFIDLDYPLAPPEQEEPAKPEPQEPTDSVWTQTIAEMAGQPSDEGRTVPIYDPQKVATLKRTLTRTLAHAANIRMRRPQEFITLVVGALDDDNAASYSIYEARTAGRGVSVTPSTRGRRTYGWRSLATSGTRPAPAALMVMRVAKAEVDAFAKGQLTLAQFTDKVQTLWSWPNWGPPTDDQRTVPSTDIEPAAPTSSSTLQQR